MAILMFCICNLYSLFNFKCLQTKIKTIFAHIFLIEWLTFLSKYIAIQIALVSGLVQRSFMIWNSILQHLFFNAYFLIFWSGIKRYHSLWSWHTHTHNTQIILPFICHSNHSFKLLLPFIYIKIDKMHT